MPWADWIVHRTQVFDRFGLPFAPEMLQWRPCPEVDGSSVQGQRFAPDIFADGFESGDTSAWSSTVP